MSTVAAELLPLIRQTLAEAGLSTADIDGVAYTAGPGLVGALLAVTLPNPIERNPAKPGPGLRRLAQRVEGMAAHAGDYVRCLE